MSNVPCRSDAPLSPTKIASNWSPQASILTAAKCLYSDSIQNPLSDSPSNTDPIIDLTQPKESTSDKPLPKRSKSLVFFLKIEINQSCNMCSKCQTLEGEVR